MNSLYQAKKIDTANIMNVDDVIVPEGIKVAFVSGVTGQDGSLMVDYLLATTDMFASRWSTTSKCVQPPKHQAYSE